MNDLVEALLVILLVLFVAVMMYFAGRTGGVVSMQEEAVEKNCAEYYLDKEHNKKWRWKCDEKEM